MDVHALDLDTWSWSKIERIKGPAPKPRADHSVCVAGSELILTGGRGSATKGFSGYYDDVHVLDLADQEWKRPPASSGALEAPPWPALPTTLWNHAAAAIESVPSYKMFVFGGQKSEFVYSNTVSILDTARKVWSNPVISGTPPGAREDCAVAYDTKTCNLIYFGGWRQGWLDDLCCLNVAGIVGPPYAVQMVEPSTGPVTGNTPVVLHGLGFMESSIVQVKFSDGKRDATVPGKFVSPTQITCNTPSFEKFGPMDVVVRVAIKGDPYTVNKARRLPPKPNHQLGLPVYTTAASPPLVPRPDREPLLPPPPPLPPPRCRRCSASTSTPRRRAAWPSAPPCCRACRWAGASRW